MDTVLSISIKFAPVLSCYLHGKINLLFLFYLPQCSRIVGFRDKDIMFACVERQSSSGPLIMEATRACSSQFDLRLEKLHVHVKVNTLRWRELADALLHPFRGQLVIVIAIRYRAAPPHCTVFHQHTPSILVGVHAFVMIYQCPHPSPISPPWEENLVLQHFLLGQRLHVISALSFQQLSQEPCIESHRLEGN